MNEKIKRLLGDGLTFRLAIDGRCGAGKTTLAGELAAQYGCAVIHLDDFFLPRGRDKEGFGNLEKDRLLKEVLLPLSKGEMICYRKFCCATQTYGELIVLPRGCSVILEGSYSLLPEFRFAYTHSLFLTVSPEEQRMRIIRRCGKEKWTAFETRWIPDEEAYLAACDSESYADLLLET